MPGIGGLPLNGEERGLEGRGPPTLASETGTRGWRGEDEGMVGDAGAWGKPLAGVDKCSGPSTGWRAGGGCTICHDPHSQSLMAVNSGVHWKPSWGGSSG